MSYDSIAGLVHDLVKNPKSSLSLKQELPLTKVKINELEIIQNVFSKFEVSGDNLTIKIEPMGMW